MSRTKFITLSLIVALFYLASCDSGGDNSNSSPDPTPMPTLGPTPMPTPGPTPMPTPTPTIMPTPMPTAMPTPGPTPMPTQNPGIENQFTLTDAFSNLNFTNPIDIQHSGDGTNRLFIAEQRGVIRVLSNLPNIQINEIIN